MIRTYLHSGSVPVFFAVKARIACDWRHPAVALAMILLEGNMAASAPGSARSPAVWQAVPRSLRRSVPPMNIVVCMKQVPDTAVERTLRPGDATLDRASVDGLINELDEYAIEEGLRIAEAHGGEVTILTMGPEKASESIRKALSMGADKAIHLIDDGLAGSDGLQTSAALAAVLGRTGF